MTNGNATHKPYLKIADAAEATGLSKYFIRCGCQNQTIPHIRSGRTYFVCMRALEKMLDELSGGTDGAGNT